MEEEKGIVFNIQKFSLHDGPGIRTVVFLKGCPLQCKWCSNPESQQFTRQILWDDKLCVRCGNCAQNCEQQAIKVTEDRVTIDSDVCINCLVCAGTCPNRALKVEGEEKTVEDVLRIVMQDVDFYEESGGGITISGGEALSQPEFTKALLAASKVKGLHTAIETTSYAKKEVYLDVTEQVDLMLCDLKHWDSQKHKEGTGVGNEAILENIKAAAERGRNILLRLPVIPGFNDSPEDAKGFVQRMRELGLHRIQLLPFHQFGENKYHSLGKVYSYENVAALHPEDLTDYKRIFEEEGMEVIL